MTAYLAPSLANLRDEVNKAFPNRDKTSDGWLGDDAHQSRPSDHNPDWGAGGVVRAIDIDIDDHDAKKDLVQMVLKATIGDSRVWYVIHNGKIYSRTYGWAARAYIGSNPHKGHIHVSLVHTREAENSKASWFDAPKVLPPIVSLSKARAQFRIALELDKGKIVTDPSVQRIQVRLNQKYKAGLKVTGRADKATADAYALHENSLPKARQFGYARVPDAQNLPLLLNGVYRMVK